MKKNNLTTLLVALVASVSLASCSIFGTDLDRLKTDVIRATEIMKAEDVEFVVKNQAALNLENLTYTNVSDLAISLAEHYGTEMTKEVKDTEVKRLQGLKADAIAEARIKADGTYEPSKAEEGKKAALATKREELKKSLTKQVADFLKPVIKMAKAVKVIKEKK